VRRSDDLPELGDGARTPDAARCVSAADYLVITSDTVGSGVRQLARYFRLKQRPSSSTSAMMETRWKSVTTPGLFAVEFVSLMSLQRCTKYRRVISEVMLRHQPDDVAAMSEAWGCPVRAMAACDDPPAAKAAAASPARSRAARVLETQAKEILTDCRREPVSRSRQRGRLPSECPAVTGHRPHRASAGDLGEVAAAAIGRRCHLPGVGGGDEEEAARRYVATSTPSLAEIAYPVGYSSRRRFIALRDGYGVTPGGQATKRRSRGVAGRTRNWPYWSNAADASFPGA
jgi:AraC-like DNA-binding protein